MSLSTSLSSSLAYGSPDHTIRTQAGLTVVKTIPQNYDHPLIPHPYPDHPNSIQAEKIVFRDQLAIFAYNHIETIEKKSKLTGPASILCMLSPSSALDSIFVFVPLCCDSLPVSNDGVRRARFDRNKKDTVRWVRSVGSDCEISSKADFVVTRCR
jgi:hypothetical protein